MAFFVESERVVFFFFPDTSFFDLEALIFGATWQIWNTTRVRVGDRDEAPHRLISGDQRGHQRGRQRREGGRRERGEGWGGRAEQGMIAYSFQKFIFQLHLVIWFCFSNILGMSPFRLLHWGSQSWGGQRCRGAAVSVFPVPKGTSGLQARLEFGWNGTFVFRSIRSIGWEETPWLTGRVIGPTLLPLELWFEICVYQVIKVIGLFYFSKASLLWNGRASCLSVQSSFGVGIQYAVWWCTTCIFTHCNISSLKLT